MKKLKSIWLQFYHIKGLKYLFVCLIAVILIGFVDENSVWHHFQNKQRISELEEAIEIQRGIHQRNRAQLKELNSNPNAIRKIARERYFMKADDEDIFVISDDSEKETNDETAE